MLNTLRVCVRRPSQSWILAAALYWTRVRWYEFLTCRIDPADMDERVARPRSYFVLARSDEALWRGAELDEVANRLSRLGLGPCAALVASRILHNASPTVQQWLKKARHRVAFAAAGGNRRTFNWQALHTKARVASAASRGASRITLEDLMDRSQSVLHIFLNFAGLTSLTSGINADLSQSLGRARLSVSCPSAQLGSAIVVGELGRLMVPMEKMLGSVEASAQVGLAVGYSTHRAREPQGAHYALDGSPGLRVCRWPTTH